MDCDFVAIFQPLPHPNSGTDRMILEVLLSVCVGEKNKNNNKNNQYFVQVLHFSKLERIILIEYDETLANGLLSLK